MLTVEVKNGFCIHTIEFIFSGESVLMFSQIILLFLTHRSRSYFNSLKQAKRPVDRMTHLSTKFLKTSEKHQEIRSKPFNIYKMKKVRLDLR